MAASAKDNETADDQAAIDAMNKNGARSIEDAAAELDLEDDGTTQLVLPGTASKLSTKIGGKNPTESYFKMSGVRLPIQGNVQVDKDTEMWIAIPVAVDDVNVRNRRKNREIVAVARTHLAVAIGPPIILDGPPQETV